MSAAVRGRGAWIAGLVAGITGLAGLVASAMFGGSTSQTDWADAELLVPGLVADHAILPWFQALMTVAALSMLVYAAGLHRRLAVHEPAGSILPAVAAAGLGVAAALSLVGAGIGTELFWGLREPDRIDPDALQAMSHIVATMAWVWAGAGLTAAAVAVSALRHGTLARWLGWVSAVLAVLTVGVSLLPMQYISGMVGALWLIISSAGLLFARRA